MLSRRSALALGAAGFGLPLLRARAAPLAEPQRRFLFVHCWGGWDTTYVFQPNFGSSIVDMEANATQAVVNGIPFVDSEERPSVRAFFENHGARTCVMNGIEVRSVTHERCSRIMLTGSGDGASDDWGARIASEAEVGTLLPYLVYSGRAFTAEHSDRVVRVGTAGQLPELLTGFALGNANTPTPLPTPTRSAAVDAYVRARHGAASGPIARAAASALDDRAALAAMGDTLAISDFPTGCQTLGDQFTAVWDTFELGLARSALLEYRGWCDVGWDTHAENFLQGRHFEELFEHLSRGLADLATRVDRDGAPLQDRVTVVLLSEMGRTPQLVGDNGRGHWTFTSAMLVGAGVAGGRVVGGYDDSGYGTAVDYASGEVIAEGNGISAANFGATVLALADVDPGESEPVTAVLA